MKGSIRTFPIFPQLFPFTLRAHAGSELQDLPYVREAASKAKTNADNTELMSNVQLEVL